MGGQLLILTEFEMGQQQSTGPLSKVLAGDNKLDSRSFNLDAENVPVNNASDEINPFKNHSTRR